MRREDEGAGHRHLRLQELVLEELRSLLRDDISDPALEGARITAVVLSADYRAARVHFVLVEEGDGLRSRAERGFSRASSFLRRRLADAIDVKRVPELRFVFDGVAAEDAPEVHCSG